MELCRNENVPFHFENGTLFCESVQIEKIIDRPESSSTATLPGGKITYAVPTTPVYVYSTAGLRCSVDSYIEAMRTANLHGKVGYAIKANPNLRIVNSLKSFGVEMLIAVSGYEVLAGLRAGFSPGAILFNGNGKQRWEIKLAIETGVMLNVDSHFDARQLVQVYTDMKSTRGVNVLLRIRPTYMSEDFQLQLHEYVNTAEKSKFGFDMSELEDILQELSQTEKIKIVGVHCHLGSGIDNPKYYEWLGVTLMSVVDELRSKGIYPTILNVGGGIGINYYETPSGFMECLGNVTDPDLTSYDVLAHYENLCKNKLTSNFSTTAFMLTLSAVIPKEMDIIVEPGRSLVGKAGILVCKSLGVKVPSGCRFFVVDGSMNEIMRPCLYGAHHHILPTTLNPAKKWDFYKVVGPICESADFLGNNIPLQTSSKYVAVMDCGAYCSSMSSSYNLKPPAAEILVDGKNWEYIRKRASFHDIIDKFNFL